MIKDSPSLIAACILIVFSPALLLSCADDSSHTSVILERKNKAQQKEYIPKRSLPAKDLLDFNVVEKENPIRINASAVRSWFDSLKQTGEFIHENSVDSSTHITYTFREKLVKDLNGDGLSDLALLVHINENDRHSFSRFYIFAFNNGVELVPVEYFYAGSFESEHLTEFDEITDSLTIKGHLVPNYNTKPKDKFPVEYHFDGREFVRKW